MDAKSKRQVAKAIREMEDADIDERPAIDRLYEALEEASDKYGWAWQELEDHPDGFTSSMTKNRYRLFIEIDELNVEVVNAELRTQVKSQAEVLQALKEI